MLRTCVAVALVLPIVLSLPGGPPDDFEYGKTYKQEIPIQFGDGMTWSIVVTEDAEQGLMEFGSCGPICQGKKHTAHKDCDASCDKECAHKGAEKGHLQVLSGSAVEIGAEGKNPPAKPHAQTMNKDFSDYGFPSTWNADRYLSGLVFKFGRMAGKVDKNPFDLVTVSTKCWHTAHCSQSTRQVKTKTVIVRLDYQLYSDSDGSGPAAKQLGPKGTLRYKVILPTNELQDPLPAVSNCRCEVPTQADPAKEHGSIPGNKEEGEYAYVEEGGKKRPITGQEIGSFVTAITCNDMNTATFEIAAMPPGKAVIPAGWELECIEGNGQNVQLQEDLEIVLVEPESRLMAALSPIDWFKPAAKTLRTLCLQIDAPEPRPSMKYRLVPPSSPTLARLARVTRRSSFKGPPDQVRLWIATDFASHEKISKMLIPAPRPSQYVREMWRAAGVNAIDPWHPKVKAIMENRLLAAEGHDPKAVAWFVRSKLLGGDATLAPWLQSNTAEFRRLFASGQATNHIGLISTICGELAVRGSAADVKAGIALLMEGVPEENRKAALDSDGGFALAHVLAITDNNEAATAILDWLETAKPVYAVAAARGVNSNLSEDIKNRAASLVGKIKTR